MNDYSDTNDFLITGIVAIVALVYAFLYFRFLFLRTKNTLKIKNTAKLCPASPQGTAGEIIFIILGPSAGLFVLFYYGADPFNKNFGIVIPILYSFSAAGFFLSKYIIHNRRLLLRTIINAALIQGILLCVAINIQLGSLILFGFILPVPGFFLTAPLAMVFLFWAELYRSHYAFIRTHNSDGLEIGSVGWKLSEILLSSFWQRNLFMVLALVSFFICEEGTIMAMGLPFDAIIRVFTETYGCTFSNHSPGEWNSFNHIF